MSFDPEYLVALDRTQAVDLFKDLTLRQCKYIDLSVYNIPGNATIRPNQSATGADDFGIFAFYVDGLGVHVSTMISQTAYERLFAKSTPNELQTRYFLTPEGQIDMAWICISRSDTSVGEIFDIEFSFEIDVPMPALPTGKMPMRMAFAIESHTADMIAQRALYALHMRRFSIPHAPMSKDGWFIDFLGEARVFDIQAVHCILAGCSRTDGAPVSDLPDSLKGRKQYPVKRGDERFALSKLADPVHVNGLFEALRLSRRSS